MRIFDTRIEMVKSLLLPNMVGAEIGVLNGDFAEELHKLNPYKLHLVDFWSGEVLSGDVDGNNPQVWNLDECYRTVQKKLDTFPNVMLHRCSSTEFLSNTRDEMFDYIYLDTTHGYEDTLQEIQYAWPKIKQGGYLMGHDFSLTYKCNSSWYFGVDRAVYKFCADNGKKIYALACDGCMSFAIKK